MNKKIATEIAFGIIFVIAVIVAGAIWLIGKSQNYIVDQPQTKTPATMTQKPQTSAIERSGTDQAQDENQEALSGCIDGTFTNPDGGYSYDCFEGWKFTITKTNEPRTDSLFGVDADENGGTGGVEVRDAESIDDFLNSPEPTITNKRKITIDGVSGIRAHYDGFPQKGEEVILFRNGKVYNIYIGVNLRESGISAKDLNFFNRVVSSFKFLK